MLVLCEQPLDALAKGGIASAGLIEECGPVLRVRSFQGLGKESLFVHVRLLVDQCDVAARNAHGFYFF